jgi:hypothetical protein
MICLGNTRRLTFGKALRLDTAHTLVDIVGILLIEHLARASEDFMT